MPNSLGLPDEVVQKRPSSLREWLSLQKPPHIVVDLRGEGWGGLNGQRVGLRSLSAGAMSECVGAAIAWCAKNAGIGHEHLYTEVGQESLEVHTRVELLARALVQPDDSERPFVEGPADVRELLTPEQVTWLFERFSDFQITRSPYELLQEHGGLERVVDDLSKGYRSPTSLNSFDGVTVRRISAALVARLARQTMPSSSASSSPAASSDASTTAT